MDSPPADRGQRILALVIDVMPLYMIGLLPPVSRTIGYFGVVPLVVLYRTAFALAGRDTMGKTTLRLAVFARDGSVATTRQRVLRESPYLVLLAIAAIMTVMTRSGSVSERVIPAFILLGVVDLALWDLVVLVASGSSSIHDLVGQTRVVSLGAKSAD